MGSLFSFKTAICRKGIKEKQVDLRVQASPVRPGDKREVELENVKKQRKGWDF